MGRRQYMTVRKRRCNERQTLKQRKEEKLLKKTRLIQRVYGILHPTAVSVSQVMLPWIWKE